MSSLRRRLLILLLIGMSASAIVTGIVVYLQACDEIDELYDAHLEQIAALVAGQVREAAWQPPRTKEFASAATLANWEEEHFLIQVWSKDGELINSLPYLDSEHHVPLQRDVGPQYHTYGGISWRIYRTENEKYIVQVAQPEPPRRATIRQTSWYLLLPLLLQVPLFLTVAWIAVRLGLSPLIGWSRELEKQRPESLQPLPQETLPSELQPLAQALNSLLKRLDIALQHQRNFVSDAAHELRTPIAALRLQLDALKRADSSAEKAVAIDALESGITRAATLINQLLFIARAENSDHLAAAAPMTLEQIGKEALERQLPVALAYSIDLGIVRLEDGVLHCAASDIAAVLDNLLGNAINYSPPGSQIDLALYPEGGDIIIEVTDAGPGIPIAERERVFDRFYRVIGNVTDGTGLGLAIVKTICDRCGARIEILDGDSGRGAKFKIRWPA